MLAPFDAWLLNQGLKTLSIRIDKHCCNAREVAIFLRNHQAINKVNYLGFEDHPHHAIAKKQMREFGGVISFELKAGLEAGIKLMNQVKLCTLTASLGTADTLIQHPASMTHFNVPKEQREKFGITDGLIRLSVGMENIEDIIEDLEMGLK
jgi:methionine-gamma-lyase